MYSYYAVDRKYDPPNPVAELMEREIVESLRLWMDEAMISLGRLAEQRAVNILAQTQGILRDGSLNDFMKVEAITDLFARWGLDSGDCHIECD